MVFSSVFISSTWHLLCLCRLSFEVSRLSTTTDSKTKAEADCAEEEEEEEEVLLCLGMGKMGFFL
jgi:hypothetical protein